MGRPATGQMPVRAIRVPDGLWQAAQAVAEEHDENLSDVLRRALLVYVGGDRFELDPSALAVAWRTIDGAVIGGLASARG